MTCLFAGSLAGWTDPLGSTVTALVGELEIRAWRTESLPPDSSTMVNSGPDVVNEQLEVPLSNPEAPLITRVLVLEVLLIILGKHDYFLEYFSGFLFAKFTDKILRRIV